LPESTCFEQVMAAGLNFKGDLVKVWQGKPPDHFFFRHLFASYPISSAPWPCRGSDGRVIVEHLVQAFATG
jgi:hypothetical protein